MTNANAEHPRVEVKRACVSAGPVEAHIIVNPEVPDVQIEEPVALELVVEARLERAAPAVTADRCPEVAAEIGLVEVRIVEAAADVRLEFRTGRTVASNARTTTLTPGPRNETAWPVASTATTSATITLSRVAIPPGR